MILKVKGTLNSLTDSEKLLAALHHKRISPLRIVQLFSVIEKIAEVAKVVFDSSLTHSYPTYLMELLRNCFDIELINRSTELSRCLNSISATADDLMNTFTRSFEARHSNIINIRSEIKLSEVHSYDFYHIISP